MTLFISVDIGNLEYLIIIFRTEFEKHTHMWTLRRFLDCISCMDMRKEMKRQLKGRASNVFK